MCRLSKRRDQVSACNNFVKDESIGVVIHVLLLMTELSLVTRPSPTSQRWMYCIASTWKEGEGSGDSCTVFVYSGGICEDRVGCEISNWLKIAEVFAKSISCDECCHHNNINNNDKTSDQSLEKDLIVVVVSLPTQLKKLYNVHRYQKTKDDSFRVSSEQT